MRLAWRLGILGFWIVATMGFPIPVEAATLRVNSTNDNSDGHCDAVHCSLREAVEVANYNGMPDTINFNIPGPGPHVINLSNSIRVLYGPLTIAGDSEPDYDGAPVIAIDGREYGAQGPSGIGVQVSDSVDSETGADEPDHANLISGDTYEIVLSTDRAILRGNRIGTNAAGTTSLPNQVGIQLQSGGDRVFIDAAMGGGGNLIAFNVGNGITSLGAAGFKIESNSIHHSGGHGIYLQAGPSTDVAGVTIREAPPTPVQTCWVWNPQQQQNMCTSPCPANAQPGGACTP